MDLSVDKKIRLRDIVSYDLSQCDDKTEFSYWNVTNSLSFDYYEKSMGKKNLNDFLIDNLRYITKRLKDDYKISFANKFSANKAGSVALTSHLVNCSQEGYSVYFLFIALEIRSRLTCLSPVSIVP